MMFGRPSLGWAKAKLPARAKPASAEIADRIIAPPGVSARHSVHSSKDAIGASPAECSDASLSFHIGRSRAHEHADAPHPLALLRARRERPRSRAAEQRDELATSHLGHGGFLPLPVGSRMLSLHLDDSALPLHMTCDEPSLRHSCLTAIGRALVITLSRTTKRQQRKHTREAAMFFGRRTGLAGGAIAAALLL